MEAGNRPVADRDVALPAFVADSTPAHPCHGHAGKLIRVTRLSARDLIDAVTDPGTYQRCGRNTAETGHLDRELVYQLG